MDFMTPGGGGCNGLHRHTAAAVEVREYMTLVNSEGERLHRHTAAADVKDYMKHDGSESKGLDDTQRQRR